VRLKRGAKVAVFEAVTFFIDYGKALLSHHSRADATTRAYWAMHGADQLMHQLTYAALILVALA
jgi:hypothetical protein